MLQPGQNTGVIITAPNPTDFIAGSTSQIPEITRNTTGDWRVYEPSGEWQKLMGPNTVTSTTGFETNACVSFSANDYCEVFIDYLIATNQIPAAHTQWLKDNGYMTDGKMNFSDRFTAKMSGTTINGNSMGTVWQSIRDNGMVPEAMWPMPSADIIAHPDQAWQLYYATVPADVIAMGLKYKQFFQTLYEWVFSAPGQSSATQVANCLKIAPLHVATAVCGNWNTDGPITGCGPGGAHATIITAEDSTGYHILDHYVPFDKTLAPNYDITYALRGIVVPQGSPVPVATPVTTTPAPLTPETKLALLTKLKAAYIALLKLMGKTPVVQGIKGILKNK